MTTRVELRLMIRRRLADTSAEPLWEDALLDDAIGAGMRRYSTRVPRQAVEDAVVLAGDRVITMPANVNPLRVVRVFDDSGTVWPRWEGSSEDAPAPGSRPRPEASWRAWGQDLVLTRAVPRDGTWRIEHLAHRIEPEDDTTPLDMQPGDDDLLIAVAVAAALERRAITDGKMSAGKGPMHPLAAAARSAQLEADRLFWERLRRARGGVVA
jgi:hypothetical protein